MIVHMCNDRSADVTVLIMGIAETANLIVFRDTHTCVRRIATKKIALTRVFCLQRLAFPFMVHFRFGLCGFLEQTY